MKHLKKFEIFENSPIEEFFNNLKRYIVVYNNKSIYNYGIYEILNKNVNKVSYTVKYLYTYHNELKKFKRHTQESFLTNYYVLRPNMITYTSDNLSDCKERVVLDVETNKYNL